MMTENLRTFGSNVAREVLRKYSEEYGFDLEDAIKGIEYVVKKKVSSESREVVKSLFALPIREKKDGCCGGLLKNHGLYTQCESMKLMDNGYCSTCNKQGKKYGTIEEREKVGAMDYIDPRGNKPIAYKKYMKKHNLSEEQVLEEAGKQGVTIDRIHFAEVSTESKRGRPKTEKEAKEPKGDGKKGRPRKSKKVIDVEGETDDLFASLVASAETEEVLEAEKEVVLEAEKEVVLEAKKAEKEAKKATEKAEKATKKATEKAEKEAKKATEKKTVKKVDEKKTEEKVTTEEEEDDEEPDVVKKIEFNGIKYLKSKNTGIIYNIEQDIVGKWCDATNSVILTPSDLVEDDYEEDDE